MTTEMQAVGSLAGWVRFGKAHVPYFDAPSVERQFCQRCDGSGGIRLITEDEIITRQFADVFHCAGDESPSEVFVKTHGVCPECDGLAWAKEPE